MSTTQYLTDAATRHQVFLQRYGAGQSKEAQKTLNRLRREINARLAQEPTVFQRNRLQAVLNDVNQLSKDAFGQITRGTIHGAQKLAPVEAGFSANLFNKATNLETGFTVPAESALIQSVMGSAMAVNTGSAITIENALEQFGKRKSAQIMKAISDGVSLGDTTPMIAKKVGTMISTLQRRQLDALVKTITNHTSSIARKEVYDANNDILDGYQWVATLDNKTTMICGSRDGKVFSMVEGSAMPPAHWNCRSTTIPKVKKEFDIGSDKGGKRPSVGATGVKQVSSRTSYGGWLKRQPAAFVDEALGVERSRLFRAGKLTLDKFVDPTGRVYTLEQLQSMNPIAFIEDTVPAIAPIKPKPKPKKKKGIVLDDVDVQGDRAAYEKELNNNHPDMVALAVKLDKPKTIRPPKDKKGKLRSDGGGAFYRSDEALVVATTEKRGGNVLRHEYGHHIDYMLFKEYKYHSISHTDEGFLKAYNDDRKLLGLHRSKTKFDAMKAFQARFYDLEKVELSSGRSYTKASIKDMNTTGISDNFDSLTFGQFQDSYGGYGHGKSYYKHKPMRYKEIFANFYYLKGSKHWDTAKELFPNLTREFDRIVKEALNE